MERSGRKRWRPGAAGCGSGCAGFFLVLLLGGALSLFNAVFGVGLSAGVPFTDSNITVAGSIGTKAKVVDALPGYLQQRLAGNQNLINHSSTFTVGPAEGAGLFVVGRQEGAPAVDLFIVLR